MDFNTYQEEARKTAIYAKEFAIIYPCLGLAGEAGEVAEKVKKVIRDENIDGIATFSEEKKAEIAKELGDVLWYIANIAADLGFSLEDIASTNLNKLRSRKERGKISGSGDNR